MAGNPAAPNLRAAGSRGILRTGGERVSEYVDEMALRELCPCEAVGHSEGAEFPFPPPGLKAKGGARALGAHAQFPTQRPRLGCPVAFLPRLGRFFFLPAPVHSLVLVREWGCDGKGFRTPRVEQKVRFGTRHSDPNASNSDPKKQLCSLVGARIHRSP